MSNQSKLDNDVKFRPNYKWPKEGTEKKCPKLDEPLQLQKNLPQYYGKPWWCHFCQWQFSEDDLKKNEKIIQDYTDINIKQIDEKVISKEKEIMTI